MAYNMAYKQHMKYLCTNLSEHKIMRAQKTRNVLSMLYYAGIQGSNRTTFETVQIFCFLLNKIHQVVIYMLCIF